LSERIEVEVVAVDSDVQERRGSSQLPSRSNRRGAEVECDRRVVESRESKKWVYRKLVAVVAASNSAVVVAKSID